MDSVMRQWWRLGGAGAILFIILVAVSFGLQIDAPTYDDPIDDIRAYWVDDGQQYLIGDYLFGIGFAFLFLPFIVSLRALLGRAEGGVNLWSRVAFLGAILVIIWGATSLLLGYPRLRRLRRGASDETLQTLMLAATYAFTGLIPLAGALFVLASSLVIVRTGVLWTWLAYLGAIEGVLGVLAPLAILSADSEGFFDIISFSAFIGLLVWVLLVGIAMVMKTEEPAAAA